MKFWAKFQNVMAASFFAVCPYTLGRINLLKPKFHFFQNNCQTSNGSSSVNIGGRVLKPLPLDSS